MDAVWDLEFTERKPLDDAAEEELASSGGKGFRKLYQCLLAAGGGGASQVTCSASLLLTSVITQHLTLAGSRLASQSIWSVLGENGVSVKSLVAVLSFFVLAGKVRTANVQQRVSGLNAAAVYLLLLGVPGEQIPRIYTWRRFCSLKETSSSDPTS